MNTRDLRRLRHFSDFGHATLHIETTRTFMCGAIVAKTTVLGSFLLREQRLSHPWRGLTGFVVPIFKAGFPVPHGPAQSKFIEHLAKLHIEAGARRRVRADVTAEFADMHRTAIVLRPFLRLLHRSAERQRTARVLVRRQRVVTLKPVACPAAQLRRRVRDEWPGWRAGKNNPFKPFDIRTGPSRALVREVKRVV